MLNYIQDNDNIENSAINTMLKDATSAYASKEKKQAGTTFSSIINNLNTKSQKTQTNFVDKVAKSNTSSINRKVIDNAPKTPETVQDTKQNKSITPKNPKKDLKATPKNEQKADNKNVLENNNFDNKPIKEENYLNNSTVEVNETQNNDTTVQSPEKNDNKENNFQSNIQKLSDINDNSFVEPSPAFLRNDELEIEKDSEILINENDVLASIGTVLAINSSENDIDKDELLEKISSELVEVDDINSVVEEISQALNEFNFSGSTKEEISNLLSKIKNIKNNPDNASFEIKEDNKENLKLEIKEGLIELSEKISNDGTAEIKDNIDITQDFNFVNEEILASADYSKDFEKPQHFNQINSDKNEDFEPKVETITEQKENKIVQVQPLDNLAEPDSEIINQEVETNEDNFNFQNENIKIADSKDITQEQTLNPNTAEKHAELDKKDLKETPKEASKAEGTILFEDKTQAFDEDSSNNQEIVDLIKENNDENITIESDLIAKSDIALNKEKNSENKIDTKSDNDSSSVEISDDKVNAISQAENNSKNATSDSNNQTFEDDNFGIKNENYISAKDYKASDKLNSLQTENQTEDFENEIDFQELEISNEDVEPTKLYAKVEQNSDTVEEINNQTENLEKMAFEQEKFEEMVVSMSKQTINTGALTVADEVAKIAINENTSINSPVNVVYDTAGDNILLKNMQLARPQENIFSELQSKLENNDILNQITEKFEQIKNTINQKFTMVLRPNDLGRLSIELTNGLKGLITNIVVQNEHVKNFIEKNINMLRTQLASAGVNVNQIQIKTAGTGDTTTYNGNNNENQGNNNGEAQQEAFKQNENKHQQNKKHYENLLASISNFDTGFANDFSSVLNKTINYELN